MASVVAILLAASSAAAGMIDESALDPWEPCALCHNLDGVSRMPKFPKLAGQPLGYLGKQLLDFRSGRRDNDGGQMQAMAGDLDDDGVQAVAGYFSALPPPPPATAVDPAVSAPARELTTNGDASRDLPACLSCHAADAVRDSGAPRLEAQHPEYLAKQLGDFRAGRRSNDPAGVMRNVAARLTDSEVRALAAYLGSLERN